MNNQTRVFKALEAKILKLVLAAMNRVATKFTREVLAAGDPIDGHDLQKIKHLWAAETPGLAADIAAVYESVGKNTAAKAGAVLPSQLQIRYLEEAENRLADIGDELWHAAIRTLSEGVQSGEGYDALRRRLMDEFARGGSQLGESRASRIARTEVQSAVNMGSFDAVRSIAVEQRPIYKQWVATLDDRTRPDHADADGQVVEVDAPFTIGGDELMAPGDPNAPLDQVINCFVGGQRVEWVGSLRAIGRRWYEGDTVELVTADGEHLTVTPNHPVLTVTGWQPAKSIYEGDEVLHVIRTESVPNVDDVPSRVEQVYGAAHQTLPSLRRSTGRVDFHGDGADGEVDIVCADGTLMDVLDAAGVEMSHELDLVSLRHTLPSSSCLGRACGPSGGAFGMSACSVCGLDDCGASSFIRGDSEIASFLRRHAREAPDVRLGARETRQSEFLHAERDGSSTNIQLLAHAKDCAAVTVEPTKITMVHVHTGAHWVYNLESSSGLLVGNGIVTHNCRCTAIFTSNPDGEDSDNRQFLSDDEVAAVLAEWGQDADELESMIAADFPRGATVPPDQGEAMSDIATLTASDRMVDENTPRDVSDKLKDVVDIMNKELDTRGLMMSPNGVVTADAITPPTTVFTTARIRGVTLVDVPAFTGSVITVTGPADENGMVPWAGVIAQEETPTGDGRVYAANSFRWEDDALGTTRWDIEDEGEHYGAVCVGRILSIARNGTNIDATGVFDTNLVNGAVAAGAVERGTLGTVSVDMDDIPEESVQMDTPDMPDDVPMVGIEAAVTANTSYPLANDDVDWDEPAAVARVLTYATGDDGTVNIAIIAGTHLWIDDAADPTDPASYQFPFVDVFTDNTLAAVPNALRAAQSNIATSLDQAAQDLVIPVINGYLESVDTPPDQQVPPVAEIIEASAWGQFKELPKLAAGLFREPTPEELPTEDGPVHVRYANGRIFGWVAQRGVCHDGVTGSCLKPPLDDVDLSTFLRSKVELDDGSVITAGVFTMGTGHDNDGADVASTKALFDDTRTVAGIVTCGVNDRGMWFSGAAAPWVSDWDRRVFASCAPSGHWRRLRSGQWSLRAVLSVPVPGFPTRLVASAVERANIAIMTEPPTEEETADFLGQLKQDIPEVVLLASAIVDEMEKRHQIKTELANLNAEVGAARADLVAGLRQECLHPDDLTAGSPDQARDDRGRFGEGQGGEHTSNVDTAVVGPPTGGDGFNTASISFVRESNNPAHGARMMEPQAQAAMQTSLQSAFPGQQVEVSGYGTPKISDHVSLTINNGHPESTFASIEMKPGRDGSLTVTRAEFERAQITAPGAEHNAFSAEGSKLAGEQVSQMKDSFSAWATDHGVKGA